jgi:phosphate transport system substrate-binding protein
MIFVRPRLCLAAVLLTAGSVAQAQVLVNGAGATFPYPIYAQWFDEFHRLHPQARINYQSIGSGAGIRQLQPGTVDFGATDCPMTDEQIANSRSRPLHFPTVLGAVVPIYNIPNVSRELNFTPEALAGILLGTLTKWNDAELRRANPDALLPDAEIVAVHRSGASGTTFVWTDYLSRISPEWKSRVGAGTSVPWPVGLGAKGNEGVAGLVKQTRYAFGYVELVYAVQNRLSYGKVRNAAGVFVRADLRSVTAAARESLERMPEDFRISITNAAGRDAYPISSYTWLLTPSRIEDPKKRKIIADFLRWMLVHGQKMAEPLGYAPLPAPVAARALKAVALIQGP